MFVFQRETLPVANHIQRKREIKKCAKSIGGMILTRRSAVPAARPVSLSLSATQIALQLILDLTRLFAVTVRRSTAWANLPATV